jgi:expansin (peptidoglycan-binding protein)
MIVVLLLAGGCSLVDALGGSDPAPGVDGGSGGDVDAGGSDAGMVCEAGEAMRSGEATFDPGIITGGACTYGPSDDMVVAVSDDLFEESGACGGCLEVERPGVGTVFVRVVDVCITCDESDLVLSLEAFTQLEENPDTGVIDVEWRWRECPVVGAIEVHFKEFSASDYLEVQVRNHRHRVASLEAQVSGAGSWLAIAREEYNYFRVEDGLGPGPFDFRITDIYGHVVVETGMALGSDVIRTGSEQFPSCE